MSLTIKIPPIQPLPPPSANELMEDLTLVKPQRNRKRPKRYIEAEDDSPEPDRKVARTVAGGRSKRSTVGSTPNDENFVLPSDNDVDMIMNDANEATKDVDHHHSESSVERTTTLQPKATKPKGKSRAPALPVARKRVQKRNVVVSETEDEDDYMDMPLDVVVEDEDDEDYYTPDEKPNKFSKGKGKTSSTKSSTGKRKAKAEPSETGQSGTDKKAGAVSAKKKTKLFPKHEEALIDVVEESIRENVASTSPATSKQESPAPTTISKKPKLPTIKKTKLPTSSSINTPVSATSSTSKLPLELGLNNKLNHDGIRKTMINKTDVDLSNKSVYQEIFLKMAGEGGTPRRTKEEERRKELNRMRDEFKARREAETRHTFDLQAQYDKISQFEDKLRTARSSALWPNFLGAKWREEYEKERRQPREQWLSAPMEGREEGEVS
ncbi:hypothetical protein BDN70DRAFT_990829 [Pholiota conissans]|uniref:Uncharacterized protein n=1 Tax=Pholiota conissans TaxID=109636 RepID=A0A9P6CWB5_9AGAR|nr:hypothetical protein BDN70DRAFT_990829 [Pholiota conissans]